MGKITISNNKVTFTRWDELTIIEPYGKDCIRCRFSKNGKILDENWTLQKPAEEAQYSISGDEKTATITNGIISVKITAGDYFIDGKITYFRKDKQILRTKHEGDYVNRTIHTEGDHYKISMIFEANPGEHLYGLGQEQEDQFDRKGSTCELIHYNTKSSMPVLYSSLGYGFFWNNPAVGRCETTNNHTMWVTNSAYQADYLVYAGETPADVMKIYCGLTGFAPKFPEWAVGFWQSKLRYETQEELLSIAREYKKRGVPISAIVIDFFHWTEQGEWKFDPRYWPNPKKMCEELDSMGIRPIVSVWPTINPNSENWEEMEQRNMLIRTEDGTFPTLQFHGMQTSIDPMNPETGPFVWARIRENYYKNGIHTYWLDNTEPEVHPENPSNF